MDIYDKYGLALETLSRVLSVSIENSEVKEIINEFLENVK